MLFILEYIRYSMNTKFGRDIFDTFQGACLFLQSFLKRQECWLHLALQEHQDLQEVGMVHIYNNFTYITRYEYCTVILIIVVVVVVVKEKVVPEPVVL